MRRPRASAQLICPPRSPTMGFWASRTDPARQAQGAMCCAAAVQPGRARASGRERCRMRDVRPAAVAGMFYPGLPADLAANVRDCLVEAATRPRLGGARPKAIDRPPCRLRLFGPDRGGCLRAPRRLACDDSSRRAARTDAPRGGPRAGAAVGRAPSPPRSAKCEVDRQAAALALALPQVVENDAAHALEHSLEVQLPFLQAVLDDFRIVPFAVGAATADEVADVIERLWGGPETLIVVSSDLSHYHRYADARAIDRGSAEGDPRALFVARPRAGVRRHADQRAAALRAPGTASCPSCSICATPATPPATARASSATRRSRSSRIRAHARS